MNKHTILALIISVSILTSCKKNFDVAQTKDAKVTSMNDLKVSSNFNWKTTKEISLNLTGYAKAPVIIKNNKDQIVATSMLSELPTEINISIPSCEEKLFLNYMGQTIEINSTNTTYKFN